MGVLKDFIYEAVKAFRFAIDKIYGPMLGPAKGVYLYTFEQMPTNDDEYAEFKRRIETGSYDFLGGVPDAVRAGLGIPTAKDVQGYVDGYIDDIRLITDQFLNEIDTKVMGVADGTPEKAHEAAKNYMAINVGMNLASLSTSITAEALSFGFIKNLGRAIDAINWGMGLGWLSWIILGTPFRAAIANPLDRYYRRKYHTAELTAAQVNDLAIKYQWPEEIWDSWLDKLGYDAEMARLYKGTAYKTLSLTQLKELWKLGVINETALLEGIKKNGYTLEDAKKVLQLITSEGIEEPKEASKSEIIRAYKEGLISEAEAKTALQDIGYSNDTMS